MVSVNPLEYMDFQKLYHVGGSLYKLVYICIWIIVYLWAYIGVCKRTTSNIKPTSKVETGTNPEAFPETLACALYMYLLLNMKAIPCKYASLHANCCEESAGRR